MVPGEKISAAIKKLWESNLFGNVDVYAVKIEGETIDLEIELIDLPGIHSIYETSSSDDERVAKSFLEQGKYDLIINVLDFPSHIFRALEFIFPRLI